MAWPLKSVIVIVALPILSICAAAVYYYHVKDKEWEEYIKKLRKKEDTVKVPLTLVGGLIGRAGTNIRELQDKTKTRITFRAIEGDQNHKLCRIIGEKENVAEAKSLILEFIDPKDIETLEMWVPQSACGRIIGRCGDNIRQISISSSTKITVDKYKVGSEKNDSDKKLITIKGKKENIQIAKEMIEKKITESENKKKDVASSNQVRSPRLRVKNNIENDVENIEQIPQYERLVAESSDSTIQVYVSSVASPFNFWLQLITPRAVDLDHLVEDMTEYYNNEENRAKHKLKEVKPGQIVVSRFEIDNKWYRVEVFGVEMNEKDPEESKVDVFYVDYGDSAFFPLRELYELRPDFLKLKFQAIEVSMAGIEPKNGGDEWEESVVDIFEDMVHSAQWKMMLAQVVGYKDNAGDKATHPGLIPCVKMYDPDGPPGVDIGKQLIERGLAVSVETEEPKTEVDDSSWD